MSEEQSIKVNYGDPVKYEEAKRKMGLYHKLEERSLNGAVVSAILMGAVILLTDDSPKLLDYHSETIETKRLLEREKSRLAEMTNPSFFVMTPEVGEYLDVAYAGINKKDSLLNNAIKSIDNKIDSLEKTPQFIEYEKKFDEESNKIKAIVLPGAGIVVTGMLASVFAGQRRKKWKKKAELYKPKK